MRSIQLYKKFNFKCIYSISNIQIANKAKIDSGLYLTLDINNHNCYSDLTEELIVEAIRYFFENYSVCVSSESLSEILYAFQNVLSSKQDKFVLVSNEDNYYFGNSSKYFCEISIDSKSDGVVLINCNLPKGYKNARHDINQPLYIDTKDFINFLNYWKTFAEEVEKMQLVQTQDVSDNVLGDKYIKKITETLQEKMATYKLSE